MAYRCREIAHVNCWTFDWKYFTTAMVHRLFRGVLTTLRYSIFWMFERQIST